MAAMDRVPNSQIGMCVAGVTLVIGASWWAHEGPWRWGTELQLWLLDAWYPSANVLFLYGLSLPFLLVPLAFHHERKGSPIASRPDLSWWKDGPGWWFALGGVVGSIALFSFAQALFAGPLVDLPVEEVSASRAEYVRVPIEGSELGYAMGLDDDWYVPIVSEGRVQGVFAVRTLGGPPGIEDLEDGSGMRATFGLPGPVLSSWQTAGLQVQLRVPVISVGGSPTRSVFMGLCIGFMALPALAMGAVRHLRG